MTFCIVHICILLRRTTLAFILPLLRNFNEKGSIFFFKSCLLKKHAKNFTLNKPS